MRYHETFLLYVDDTLQPNLCIGNGIYLNTFKTASVTPAHKTGPRKIDFT